VEELEAKIAISTSNSRWRSSSRKTRSSAEGSGRETRERVEDEAMDFAGSQSASMSAAVLEFMERSRSLPRLKMAAASDRFVAERVREAFEAWRAEFERRAAGRVPGGHHPGLSGT